MGTVTALAILKESLAVATGVSALIATAQAEKRDVTMEELNGFAAGTTLALAALDATIKKAGG